MPLNKTHISIGIIFILLASCGTNKKAPYDALIINPNPKLIFLNYTVTQDTNGHKTVEFISKTIANGKEKSRNNNYLKAGYIGDLECLQLDKKDNILQRIFIKNPLLKNVEYVNDSLQFENKLLKLKKAPLSIRLQLNPETERIHISEIIDSLQQTKSLFFTKLETK